MATPAAPQYGVHLLWFSSDGNMFNMYMEWQPCEVKSQGLCSNEGACIGFGHTTKCKRMACSVTWKGSQWVPRYSVPDVEASSPVQVCAGVHRDKAWAEEGRQSVAACIWLRLQGEQRCVAGKAHILQAACSIPRHRFQTHHPVCIHAVRALWNSLSRIQVSTTCHWPSTAHVALQDCSQDILLPRDEVDGR